MARKIKNAVVKAGEYQDRNTGERKSRWLTIGAVMRNDDGSEFMILERHFNPAGLPDKDGRGTVIVNFWDPQDQGDRPGRGGSGAGSGAGAGGGAAAPLDDEIPF